MRIIKSILIFTIMLTVSFGVQAAKKDKSKKAEDIYSFAEKIEVFDKEAAKELRSEMKSLTRKERKRLTEMVLSDIESLKEGKSVQGGDDMILYYILAVLLPPLAVGLYTDWQKPTLFNLLFTIIGWLPGVIHAFIVFGA
jgi:uncharacterized membrane protein YqaE (UPF0057 family)